MYIMTKYQILPYELSQFTQNYEESFTVYLKQPEFDHNVECLPSINSRHPKIKNIDRSKLVDWIQHVCGACKIEDPGVFFSTVQLFDIFYTRTASNKDFQDLQLTAIASILITTKLHETQAVKLARCSDNLSHG
jgi:hypothetical protein